MGSTDSALCDCIWERRPVALDGIIDMHIHLGTWAAFPIYGGDADSLVRQMDRVGIAKAICSHEASMTPEVVFGNDEVLAAMDRHPDRIMGYAATYPVNDHLGINEVKRCIDAGMTGIKMHNANKIPYTSPKYTAIWRYADDNGLLLLLHTWGGLDTLEPVFKEYGNTSILLAHAGCTRADDYVKYADEYPHVYLDLAYSGCKYGLVEYFVQQVGAQKIVFGSDMPWMSLGQQIGKVLFADITEEQKRTILVDNPRRILGTPEDGS